VALLTTLLAVVAGASPASASQADDYANAIHRALTLVQFAERGDAPSLQQALRTLEQAPGPSQPEILRDLRAVPPNLDDADKRLQALDSALQARVDTPDPARASQQLTAVLSMPRYAGLTTGPSLIQQIVSAIGDAISSLLRWLGVGNLHLNVPLWAWLILALVVLLGIVVWLIRGTLGRGGREAMLRRSPSVVRPSTDFFAEADRLAGAGDYLAAIRALAGGVAVKLSGERAWDQSPFTVRELFQRSKDPETLRPLLRSFEEASYGHRPPDQTMYAQAAEAAQPYRRTAA
jgi:HPt (histidine-containing phosphotransfer) domain-containing protein